MFIWGGAEREGKEEEEEERDVGRGRGGGRGGGGAERERESLRWKEPDQVCKCGESRKIWEEHDNL